MLRAVLSLVPTLLVLAVAVGPGQVTPKSMSAPAPGIALELQDAILRAAPGATVYANDYPPPGTRVLVIDKPLTLVGGHFEAEIVIDNLGAMAEPAPPPFHVAFRAVSIDIAGEFDAIEVHGQATVSLVRCRVRTLGHFGVNLWGPAIVRESVVETLNPWWSIAVSATRAWVFDSTIRAAPNPDEGENVAIGLGYGTLVIGRSEVVGSVFAGNVLEVR